jgi:AraC family transcriptional regulator
LLPDFGAKYVNRGGRPKPSMISDSRQSLGAASPAEIESFLPHRPTVSSAGMWSGLRVAVCDTHPPAEVDLPHCTHHIILMNLRPLERLVQERQGQVRETAVPEQGLIIVPAGVPTKWRWDSLTAVIVMFVAPKMMATALSRSALSADVLEIRDNFVFRDQLIEQMALALRKDLELGSLGGRLFGESLGNALAIHLLRYYSTATWKSNDRHERLSGYHLRQVIQYVEENLASNLNLAELSAVTHLSPCHFARAFRQSTGLPPHRYVLTRRVERAKRLLAEDRMRIVDIGHSLGFSDQSQFTRVFHAIAGITPARYQPPASRRSMPDEDGS